VPVSAKSSPPDAPATANRILAAARQQLFAYGYSAFTMDDLARDLGMSKKTLYVHFPSKDAIVERIIDGFSSEVLAMADAIFADRELGFIEKLRRFTTSMVERFGRLHPHMLRDLERSAPHIYRHIEDVRYRNIPHVFGQLLRQGQAAGRVRADLDPAFAIEFWRPAIQGLMHPQTLERLKLRPDEAFTQAINLFFGGLLTPVGHKEYEKLPPR
jgi:AcrR family transcriptional regulator